MLELYYQNDDSDHDSPNDSANNNEGWALAWRKCALDGQLEDDDKHLQPIYTSLHIVLFKKCIVWEKWLMSMAISGTSIGGTHHI